QCPCEMPSSEPELEPPPSSPEVPPPSCDPASEPPGAVVETRPTARPSPRFHSRTLPTARSGPRRSQARQQGVSWESSFGRLRALGEPARVRIVNVIATAGEPVCVCELVEPLGLGQPTVSHHLKKLTEAGLVVREQRGKWAYFTLNRDAVETLAAVADLKGA